MEGRCRQARSTHGVLPPLRRWQITGPAAGHDKMKTSADPDRHGKVLGTVNNCAGAYYAVGHLVDVRGELQRIFLEQGRRGTSHPHAVALEAVTARRVSGMPGASITTASTLRRSQTSRTASAGSSRSTLLIRPRRRSSAPRLVVSSTKVPATSSTRTAVSSSTRATISASTTSISSLPTARSTRQTRR